MPSSEEYLIKIQLQVQNDQALKALTQRLEQTAKSAPKAEKAMKNAGTGAKRFGSQAQNASYQLTDFIVQIEGGTSASRAFAQQAPQLLAGFGALGAAIGVAAALMPSLIKLFIDAAEETLTFDDSLANLDKTLGNINSVIDGIDFGNWNKSWNEAGVAVKGAEIKLLEFRAAVAESGLQELMDSFALNGGAGAAADGMDRFAASVLGLFNVIGTQEQLQEQFGRDNFAEYLGITSEAAEDVRMMMERLRNGTVELDAFRAALLEAAGPTPNAAFAALIEQVVELQARQKQVADTRQQIADANQALVQGTSLPTDSKGSGGRLEEVKVLSEEIPTAYATAAIAANDYNQMQQEYLQTQYDLQQQYMETADVAGDSFDAMAEAGKVFDKTFETAFDGVAMGTQSVSDAFENMAKSIIAQLLKIAAQQAIMQAFGIGIFGAAAPVPSAKGNVFSGGNIVPFASGGIVNSPTMFPMAKGTGLMGEAGPEAIVPLKRTSGGDLGVQASPVNVTVNNMAPGVSVNARQGENGLTIDVVMQQMSQAIRRGGNPVADAMEASYSLGRGRAVY